MMSQTSVNLLSRIAQVSRFTRSLFSSSPSGQGSLDLEFRWMEGKREGSVRESCEILFILSSCMYSLEVLSWSILFSSSTFLFFFSLLSTIQHGWCNCNKNSFIEIERGGEKLNTIREVNWRFGRKNIFIINYTISLFSLVNRNKNIGTWHIIIIIA